MKYQTILAAAAVATVVGSGAIAAPLVSIDTIDSSWQNPQGDATFTTNNVAGGGTDSLRWGDPASNDGQSGYDFTPAATPYQLAPDTPAILGTFTHLNRPIFASGGSLESVELSFSFTGSVLEDAFGNTFNVGDLPPQSFGAVFEFGHDETTNSANVGGCGGSQQSGVPCDDIVTVSAFGGASETVTVGLTEFTFTLLGFSLDGGATFSNEFITTEGLNSSADLYFDYSVSVIPLPAAGWLMIAGLGALGAVGRRRRKAA